MKWIGRILYIVFALLLVGFIELNLQGVNGIQRSLYVGDTIASRFDTDENYNVHDGLAHLNAALNRYYSDQAIPNLNDETHYDTTTETIDDLYKIKFSLYPMISTLYASDFNIWLDGFYIVLDQYHEDIDYFSLKVVAYHVADPEQNLITRSNTTVNEDGQTVERPEFNIYLTGEAFFFNSRVPETTYISNSYFFQPEHGEFDHLNEYHIVAIEFYAHEKEAEDSVFIYRVHDGSVSLGGTPLVSHDTLNLDADSFNLSKRLENLSPTQNDIDTYRIVTTYHPLDLSNYQQVFFIIYGIYALFIVVIPYFWFIHPKIMAYYRLKKPPKKSTQVTEDPKEQIFYDYVPKEDDKKDS